MTDIRRATAADIPAITEIYNEAVATTTATFDTEPKTVEQQRAWFEGLGPRHPVLVAECDGVVCGWACLKPWSDRKAYDATCETSFYVHSARRGRGIGRALKGAVVQESIDLGYHSIIARAAEGSDASLHLNREFGFEMVGTLKQVGRKFGRLLDVHVMQKMLGESKVESR